MDDKLLGGLMNSLAARAIDETIRIPLSLPTSLLKINTHVYFVLLAVYLEQHQEERKGELTTGLVAVLSSDFSSLELFNCWSNN